MTAQQEETLTDMIDLVDDDIRLGLTEGSRIDARELAHFAFALLDANMREDVRESA